MTTVLLHGFWGQPSDWNRVLQVMDLGRTVLTPDLYFDEPITPQTPLSEWPKRFWQWIDHEVGDAPITLIGYSLGARLALNACLHAPTRVHRALLLSGQVLLPESAHAARLQWESEYAERFLHEDWTTLSESWQEQSVFAGTSFLQRREDPALRRLLGLSLVNWSPRLHPFGWSDVKQLPSSVHWAFGALDQNYRSVVNTLQELPVQGQIAIIPNVGHRVIQDAAEWIGEWIENKP